MNDISLSRVICLYFKHTYYKSKLLFSLWVSKRRISKLIRSIEREREHLASMECIAKGVNKNLESFDFKSYDIESLRLGVMFDIRETLADIVKNGGGDKHE